MRKNKSRRFVALLLAMFTLGAPASVRASGTASGTGQSTGGTSLQNIKEIMSAKSYSEYRSTYSSVPTAKQTIKVNVTEYDRDETDAEVEVLKEYAGKTGDLLKTPETGTVAFKVDVPETAMYAMRFSYCALSDRTVTAERTLYINGSVPFTEARFLKLVKNWVNDSGGEDGRPFRKDMAGNEIKPTLTAEERWQDYTVIDASGFNTGALLFYLEKGENTIALTSVYEDVIIADLELFAPETTPTYDEYMAKYGEMGRTDEVVHLDAEAPTAVSNYYLQPQSDPKSAMTEPQSASATMMNVIEGAYWANAGEWVEYEFDIEKAGLYTLMVRFRQDAKEGFYNTRALYVDGELPYAEAADIRFAYGSKWQTGNITDGEKTIEFYLEPGHHTIRLEVSLGNMAEVLSMVSAAQKSVNNDYLEIVRLTGAVPDEYRDYGFARVMPDVLQDMIDQSAKLYEIVDYMKEVGGGNSENSTTIQNVAELLHDMGTDERQIAKNLEQLKNYVGTLSTWVSGMSSQGLDIDYINVQSADGEVPKAESNWFQRIWYEILKFFSSFFTDFNALRESDSDVEATSFVTAWTNVSREQAQIIKGFIDSQFSVDYNIGVTIKIVDQNTLLPAILAGIGPDIALDGMTNTGSALSTNTVTTTSAGAINDYALRGAVEEIDGFEGFEDMRDWFTPGAFESMSLSLPNEQTGLHEEHVYGVPTKSEWPMMFYRADILSALDLEIPQTWDDLLSTVPVLQFNNMDIIVGADIGMFGTMLFQRGGEFWADDGMRVNFDSNTALEAFEVLMNMYTQYSLPIQADSATRFRTGESPIVIANYSTYNTFSVFSTELAGLWSFDLIPGTLKEDGTIDHSVIGSSDGICMLRGCKDRDAAWELMKWYAGEEFQTEFVNAYSTLIGEGAKGTPANIKTLGNLTWTRDEYEKLTEQSKWVKILRQNPGSYIITRNVNFSIRNTYNEKQDAVDTLLGYINDINKEISRKREEFGLETLEIGQTLAEKRLSQATEALDDLGDGGGAVDAARDAIRAANTDSAGEAEIAALRSAASGLSDADSGRFAEVVGYMNDAAAALESYM